MDRDVGLRERPRDGAACMSCLAVGSEGVSPRVRGSVPGRRRPWRNWRRTCHLAACREQAGRAVFGKDHTTTGRPRV
jgi:hypothetical protein